MTDTVERGQADDGVVTTRRTALQAAAGALAVGQLSGGAAAEAVGPTVYVCTSEPAMYAVDAETGENEWTYSQSGVGTAPTVVEGTVYVGAGGLLDGTVYAVDAVTGDQNWAYEASGEIGASPPTVVDGTVYLGTGRLDDSDSLSDGSLYAVDAEAGEKEWAFTEPEDFVTAAPAVVEGTVYAGSDGGRLYAVDAATGEQEWVFTEPADGAGSLPPGIESSPTVVEGTVYVGSTDGTVYALDAASGREEWSFTEPSGVYASPTVADGTLYIGTGALGPGTLYALDAATGETEWAFTEPTDFVDIAPTVVANPRSGDSIGSRVQLGTLGHHDDIDRDTPGETSFESAPSERADEDGSGPGFGVGGALAALAGAGYLLERGRRNRPGE